MRGLCLIAALSFRRTCSLSRHDHRHYSDQQHDVAGCYCMQPQHGWGTKQLEICTVLENGKGMSGAELENLFHLGHERKARQQMDIDNAIYAHFGTS